MLWVATERASTWPRRRAVRRRRVRRRGTQFGHVQRPRRDLAQPVGRSEWRRLPDRAGDLRAWLGEGSIGAGLGLGDPDRIPAVETDFIFAAIGEELGLLGRRRASSSRSCSSSARVCASPRAPSDRSRSCSRPGSRRSSACRPSSSSAASPAWSRSPASRCRSCRYGGSSLVANYVLLALLMRISDEHARRSGEVRPRQTRRDKSAAPTTSRRSCEQADPPPRDRDCSRATCCSSCS